MTIFIDPDCMVDPEPSRLHQLARLPLIDLQAIYLSCYGYDRGRAAIEVLSGADIEIGDGRRIRLVPWDRDRYATAIVEFERHGQMYVKTSAWNRYST